MAPKGLKLGSKIWVKDQDTKNPDVFVMAELKGIVGGHISVRRSHRACAALHASVD